MPSAAQQRWLLRGAVAAVLLGGCAAATASLLSSDHLAALPLRFATEAWLASGNLTSDLLSSAGGGKAGCVGAARVALRLSEAVPREAYCRLTPRRARRASGLLFDAAGELHALGVRLLSVAVRCRSAASRRRYPS